MTFVWKDKALRAAGKRGVAKARAYGLATNRRAPITLAKVRWLERPIIPASARELTGKPPAGEVAPRMQSPVRLRRASAPLSIPPLILGSAPQRRRKAEVRVARRRPLGRPCRAEHGARIDFWGKIASRSNRTALFTDPIGELAKPLWAPKRRAL